MKIPVSEHGTSIFQAFKNAWEASIIAYKDRRINSERCLQSNLFHFLTIELEPEFQIFVEATVRLPTGESNGMQKKVHIDTVICRDDVVYAAIELKYSPKGQSKKAGIRKDLTSLSHIKNRLRKADKLVIEMPKHRNSDGDIKTLSVDKSVRLIFGAFLNDSGPRVSTGAFWNEHRPGEGRWAGKKFAPPRLGVAIAYTDKDGGATASYFGPAFGGEIFTEA